MSPYRSPAALRQALGQRARKLAQETGVNSGELVRLFLLDRLLARVFTLDPHDWMLKGGQALLVRYPRARYSRDLDLLYQHTSGLDEAVRALRLAADHDLHDHLRYVYYDTTTQHQGRPARTVRFQPYLGGTAMTMVSVDLVADLAPIGEPIVRPLTSQLDLMPFNEVEVRLYPVSDHVADKICALYEQHPSGASSRVKDLVDLVVIALREPVDGVTTHRAIREEVTRRRHAGTRIELPTVFTVPDPDSWRDRYRQQATTVAGLDAYRSLDAVVELATRFVGPLLGDQAPRWWDPDRQTWA